MADTAQIQIITTLEYLGTYDSGDPYWGATVSVGVDGPIGAIPDETLARDILRPWLWKTVGFSLFGLKKDGLELKNRTDGKMCKRPVRDVSGLVDVENQQAGALDQAFGRALNVTGSISGRPFRSSISDKPLQSDLESATGQPPWPAVLGQISQMPYPIPHVLNISSFFQAKMPSGCDFVIAIPTFRAGGTTFDADGSADLLGEVAAKAVYKLSPSQNLSVTSASNRIDYPLVQPAARSNKPTRMDANDPYVPIASNAVYDSDWLTNLPVRLGEAFDLGQRVIDCFGSLLRDAPAAIEPAVLQQQIPQLRACLVSSLYELANTGVDRGPDGGSVFDFAVQGVENVDEAALKTWRDSLSTHQASIVGKPAKISELFRTNVREAATCPALAADQSVPAVRLDPDHSAPNSAISDAIKGILLRETQEWEALQSALARDVNIAALVVAQWKQADLAGSLTQRHKDLLIERAQLRLATSPLRRRFALANLARGERKGFWGKVTQISNASNNEREDISKNFQKTLHDVLEGRLSDCKVDAKVIAALLAKLDAWAKLYSDQTLVPKHEASPTGGPVKAALPAGSISPTVPHGISVQADRLYTFSGDTEEQSDMARRSSGFAVFMSDKKGPKAWRCLSLALAQFPGRDGKPGKHWEDPVLVPFPIQDEAGLRKCLITYDNGPLSSVNPASRMAPMATTGAGTTSIVSYANAYRGQSGWAKLPPLVNGRAYRFLVARISNSGALPKELAKKGSPGELGDPDQFDPKFLGDAYLPEVRYLRRVPVGGLRIGSSNGSALAANKSNQKLVWGENVSGIQPRALEQPPPIAELIGRSKPASADPKDKTPDSFPVLVLKNKPFAFSVSRPATDVQTWDRHIAGPANRTALRKAVWSRVWSDRAKYGEVLGRDTLLLEDPAVSSYVLAELVTEVKGSDKRSQILKAAKWNVNSSPQSVEDLQTQPLTVNVKPAGLVGDRAFFSDGEQIEINVPSGIVAYLHLTTVLIKAEYDKFFPGVVTGQTLGGLAINGIEADKMGDFYAVPPFSMAIEAVSATIPDADALRRQLAVNFVGDRLNLSLTRDGSEAYKNVGRVEVLRQRWHWNGRPFGTAKSKFPVETFNADGTENGSSDERRKWMLQAFAARQDYEVLSTRLAKASAPADTRFERSDDISSEPQGTVYRFAVRAWNRYAALLSSGQSSDSAAPSPDDLTAWKSIYVPCRSKFTKPTADNPGKNKPGQVPVPHIKLILPLTEAAEDDDQAHGVSGLLVVLEGPWFTVGGVTESLECELATTVIPDTDKPVQEAGFDPVRSHLAATGKYELRPLIGPVGHTFDESEALPKFVNTSFVLPGPKKSEGGDPKDDLSLFFGKVRFRRSIQLGTGQDSVSSDATDSYWVQFLPRFVFQFDSEDIAEKSVVTLSGDGRTVKIGNGAKNLVVRRSTDDLQTTRLFGILTSVINDVTGRHAQEHYLGFFRYEDGNWKSGTPVAAQSADLRFRIVETEVTPNFGPDPGSLSQFWERLFPSSQAENDEGLEDSKARIFRVSRPIGSTAVRGGKS